MQVLRQAIGLVSEPPGSFVYFVLTLFALEAAYAIAWGQMRQNPQSGARRLALAAGLSLGAKLLLVLLVGWGALELLSDDALLPPLDRAITTATFLLLAWALAVRPPARLADAALVASLLAVFIAAIVSLVVWYPAGLRGEQFNNTLDDQLWQALQLGVLLASIGLLLWRRPPDWGAAFGLFGLLALAVVAHLVQSFGAPLLDGHPAAFTRMAETAALPLFAVLVYRHALRNAAEVREVVHEKIVPTPMVPPPGKAQPDFSVQAAQALAAIGTAADASTAVQLVTEGIGKVLRADIALLWSAPGQDRTVTCAGGYDLIREAQIMGFSVARVQLGSIGSTIARGKPGRFRLPAHANELSVLAERIGLAQSGPAFVAPMLRDKQVYGALMIFSPYSQKDWDNEERKLLAALADPVAQALTNIETGRQIQADLEAAREQAQTAEADAQAAREFAERMTADLQETREQLERDRAQLESLTVLVQEQQDWQADTAAGTDAAEAHELVAEMQARVEGLQQERDQLAERLTALEAASVTDASTDSEQLQAQIQALQAERDDLASRAVNLATELDGARRQIAATQEEADRIRQETEAVRHELEAVEATLEGENVNLDAIKAARDDGDGSSREVILSIAQDLRQPMSSIVGYTDLLMGESAGIIGALQRKFLERIKSSTERMGVLLDDLVRVSAIDTGTLELGSDQVDVTSVLEEAIMSSGTQFREKGITLRMDIDEALPPMQADRDSLYQIMQHLLSNAALASRVDGEVEVTAHADSMGQPDGEFLLIAVRDSGEGIPPEDQSRVFGRMYRADNPLIPGLGDTGVGLSIVKTLVEAHGGRIWVDSELGVGSTFNVLLPANARREDSVPATE